LAKMKECPICGQKVGLDNIESHFKKVHPKEKIEVEFDQKEREDIKKTRKTYRPRIKVKGKHIFPIVVIVVVATILVIVFNPTGLKVGDSPPDFTLSDIYYRQWNLATHLSDGDDRPILMEFISLQCTYCESMAPILYEIYDKYTYGLEMVSIAIALDPSSPPKIPEVIQKADLWNIEWTCLVETSGTFIRDHYRPQGTQNFGTPTFCIIGKDAKVGWIHVGTISYGELEIEVLHFLAQ